MEDLDVFADEDLWWEEDVVSDHQEVWIDRTFVISYLRSHWSFSCVALLIPFPAKTFMYLCRKWHVYFGSLTMMTNSWQQIQKVFWTSQAYVYVVWYSEEKAIKQTVSYFVKLDIFC